jgi:hypothetical protein
MLLFLYVEAIRNFNTNEPFVFADLVLCPETEITFLHIYIYSIFLWQKALFSCTSNVTIKHESKAHVFKISDVICFYLMSSLFHLVYYHLYITKNKKGTEYKTRIFFLIHDLKNEGGRVGLAPCNDTQTSECSDVLHRYFPASRKL